MALIQTVPVEARSIDRFIGLVGQDAIDQITQHARLLREQLAGRAVWNINSTAKGGGVAEMLASLLGYPRELGIDVRWAVIHGTPEFFRITKRLHHGIQGESGDASPLGEEQHRIYEHVLQENAEELGRMTNPGDIVVLHDPQTAGLAPHMMKMGSNVIWRCHIGDDLTNQETERAWSFLAWYLNHVPLSVFSRHAYVPRGFGGGQAVVVPPSIDPFSPKSEALDQITVQEILVHSGLVAGEPRGRAFEFASQDGSLRRVERSAEVVSDAGPPPWEAPLVVQVSRWDPIKDPVGVVDVFTRLPPSGMTRDAHLMLVGPDITGVADDPEAGATLERLLEHWRSLPQEWRRRVHIALLPMADVTENALMVSALQSHASVIVQKSLKEGFGLTVTEAMWKECAIVASGVGGIQDQIDDGAEGLLVSGPRDLEAFACRITELLTDQSLARRLGTAAKLRVTRDYLPTRHLLDYANLIEGGL